MFTGIVQEAGSVESVHKSSAGIRLAVRSQKAGAGLKIGDSVAVNGCCLTVVKLIPQLSRARAATGDKRLDQPRLVPRLPGLYVISAFGSRGITWAMLAARVLAASVSGAPIPLEADLLDAIDPARFICRRARRQTTSGAPSQPRSSA